MARQSFYIHAVSEEHSLRMGCRPSAEMPFFGEATNQTAAK